MTTYCVHAREDAVARPHRVEARDPVDAALTYAERWLSPLPAPEPAGGPITLIVEDEATGRERCLTLHLDSGEVEPCG